MPPPSPARRVSLAVLEEIEDTQLTYCRGQRIINATVHSGIGVAPAKLVFAGMVDKDRCLVPDKVPSVMLDGIEMI